MAERREKRQRLEIPESPQSSPSTLGMDAEDSVNAPFPSEPEFQPTPLESELEPEFQPTPLEIPLEPVFQPVPLEIELKPNPHRNFPEIELEPSFQPTPLEEDKISSCVIPEPESELTVPQFAPSEPNSSVHQFSFPSAPEEPSEPCDDVQVPYHAAHVVLETEPEPQQDPQPKPVPAVDLNYILDRLLLEDDKEIDSDFEPSSIPYEHVSEKDLPIYSGAPITLHQSFVAILTLVLSFKVSGALLNAILQLISLHFTKQTTFKPSLYFFKNYFANLQSEKDYMYFCSKCYAKCDKSGCLQHVSAKLCTLIRIPLMEQLKTMFTREGFYAKLNFETSHSSGKYKDIYDGNVYQNEVKSGRLGIEGRISCNWNTDGMSMYESSQISVWPFYLNINELPYHERCKKENVLLPLVWCGPKKPPASILVSELYPDLQLLSEGVLLDIPNVGQKKISGYVISGSGDTPARSMMMNLVQYNGESSCQRCEQPGEPRHDHPGVRIFSYKPSEMTPRTVKGMAECGDLAKPKKPCKGVKGVPPLQCIMPDSVNGVSIDPMHQLYGGVTKKVLSLLTTSPKEKPYSIKIHLEKLNERLQNIRPPAHVPRVSRSLEDSGYWKMSEYKTFLLDTSLPLLKDIVSSDYLKHHATLVAGVQFLNSNAVSSENKATADALLNKYVAQFADHYEKKNMTINVHLLLHLSQMVEDLGPLWVYACFDMEALNGIILSLVHGTRWPDHQIGNSVQTCLGHSEVLRNMESCDSKRFCEKILNRNKLVTSGEVGKIKIVGPMKEVKKLPEGVSNLIDLSTKVHELGCIKIGKFIYVALSKHKREARRDSTTAVFLQNGKEEIGFIKHFYRKFSCTCPVSCDCCSEIFAVLERMEVCWRFETLIPGVTVPNTAQYKTTNEVIVIKAECLLSACTKIEQEHLYISKPCNTIEVE